MITKWYETTKELFPYRVVLRAQIEHCEPETLEVIVVTGDAETAASVARAMLQSLARRESFALAKSVMLEIGPCGTNAIGSFREVEN